MDRSRAFATSVCLALVLAGCQCGDVGPGESGTGGGNGSGGAASGGGMATGGGIATGGADATGGGGVGGGMNTGGGSATGGGSSTGGGNNTGGGTTTGGGSGMGGGANDCLNVTCNAPPMNVCANSQQLRIYESPGACADGVCNYSTRLEACPNGCAAGKCNGDPCVGVTCNMPLAAVCTDATTLKQYAAQGTCAQGACSYAESFVTCQFGCANGQCKGDPCSGKVCNQPPATFCFDPQTRRSFGSSGTCAGGSCTYTVNDTTCAYGCANGQCNNDPCAGKVCDMPPAKTCVNGNARVYSPSGTCAAGSCSYTYSDTVCSSGCSNGQCSAVTCGGVSCNTPPASTCTTAKVLKVYAPSGSCVSNACSYASYTLTCSEGCFNGACITNSWEQYDVPGNTLWMPTFVIDAALQPHLAGCMSGTVVHRFKSDLGWVDETLDPSLGTACSASIALDGNGVPAMAYYDSTNGDLRFARRVGGTWSVKELVATTGDVGRGASLTFTPDGVPHISAMWRSGSTDELRVYTRQSNGTWGYETVTARSLGWDYVTTELRADSAGTLFVVGGAFYSSGVALKLVLGRRLQNGWSVTEPVAGAFLVRGSLAVPVVGKPRFGYVRSGLHAYDESSGALSELTFYGAASLAYFPSMVLDGARQVSMWTTETSERRDGMWQSLGQPIQGLATLAFSDSLLGPDNRVRFLSSSGEKMLVSPPCVAQCGGRACGSDSCGGSCGTCSTGSYCGPEGQCSPWRVESIDSRLPETVMLALSADGGVAVGVINYNDIRYAVRGPTGFPPMESVDPLYAITTNRFGMQLWGNEPVFSYVDSSSMYSFGTVKKVNGSFARQVAGNSTSMPPALALDGQGQPHLVQRSPSQRVLTHYWANGLAWQSEVIVGTEGDATSYGYPNLTIDSAGHAHVIFSANSVPKYASNASGSWVVQTVQTTTLAESYGAPQIAVDSAKVPHVVYATGQGNWWYATKSNGTWVNEVFPAALVAGNVSAPTLTLDSLGVPFIAYARNAPGQEVVVAKRTAANTWSKDTVPTYSVPNVSTMLKFDMQNRPHVVFEDNGVLRYATKP